MKWARLYIDDGRGVIFDTRCADLKIFFSCTYSARCECSDDEYRGHHFCVLHRRLSLQLCSSRNQVPLLNSFFTGLLSRQVVLPSIPSSWCDLWIDEIATWAEIYKEAKEMKHLNPNWSRFILLSFLCQAVICIFHNMFLTYSYLSIPVSYMLGSSYVGISSMPSSHYWDKNW